MPSDDYGAEPAPAGPSTHSPTGVTALGYGKGLHALVPSLTWLCHPRVDAVAGGLSAVAPHFVITVDVARLPRTDVVARVQELPFANGPVDSVFATTTTRSTPVATPVPASSACLLEQHGFAPESSCCHIGPTVGLMMPSYCAKLLAERLGRMLTEKCKSCPLRPRQRHTPLARAAALRFNTASTPQEPGMAGSVNKVAFVGNAGRVPEARRIRSG